MWTNFRALIGIFSQTVGPSLAIWANIVQFSLLPLGVIHTKFSRDSPYTKERGEVECEAAFHRVNSAAPRVGAAARFMLSVGFRAEPDYATLVRADSGRAGIPPRPLSFGCHLIPKR